MITQQHNTNIETNKMKVLDNSEQFFIKLPTNQTNMQNNYFFFLNFNYVPPR